jgi:hypothetical protein
MGGDELVGSNSDLLPTQQLPAAAEAVVKRFVRCTDAKQRYQLVLEYAEQLPPFPEALKQTANRVLGCTAQVCGGMRTGRALCPVWPTRQLHAACCLVPPCAPAATAVHTCC